jgi:hypothetical protein
VLCNESLLCSSQLITQFLQVQAGKIGEADTFEVVSEPLVWIQTQSTGRKPLQVDSSC